MNQRLELVLETTHNDRLYRLSMPFRPSDDEVLQVLDDLKTQINTMIAINKDHQKKLSEEQSAPQ